MLAAVGLSASGVIPVDCKSYDVVWRGVMPVAASCFLLETDIGRSVAFTMPAGIQGVLPRLMYMQHTACMLAAVPYATSCARPYPKVAADLWQRACALAPHAHAPRSLPFHAHKHFRP